MKKPALAFLAILMAACIFYTGCQKRSEGMTITPGILSIGMEIGYPPMEYYGPDGKTKMGFDVEMGIAIANRLGMTPEFIDQDWDGIFAAVETRRFDAIMSSVTVTPERLDAHNFSKPYIANTLAMVLLKGSPITARSPQECSGLDVSYQLQTTADFYMQELEKEGLKYNARGYEKVMNCFDELRLGRVDVIVTDLLVAYDYISPTNPFEIVWESSEPEVFGICIKKGNDALTDAINGALEELFADGTMFRISNDIFGMDLVTTARENW